MLSSKMTAPIPSVFLKNRWMIAFTVILLAVVEVLDITIVSVALLNMKGALSASPDQITWTITVYVIAAAIFMPLTGFLTKRFGRRRLLFWSALGFAAASFLCGLAQTLTQMILFRGLQGAFGALLPTLAQSTLLDTFRGEEANKAMAFFGVGIMLAPILGPILGGYITDTVSWRWIFFINVPICLIAAALTLLFLVETPIQKVKTDWVGLLLLALSIGSMQYILDKGNDTGWFSSHWLLGVAVFSLLAWFFFLLRGIGRKAHVINFAIFKDKNYTLSCLAMLIYCGVLLGAYSWLPLWLEIFMHYPAMTVGLVLIPRGVACLLGMFLMPTLLKWLDARLLVIIACIAYAAGSYLMVHFNLTISPETLLWPNVLQGLATGFFFVPLTALAYQTLSPAYLDEASGLFNFFRSLGSSIGVALFSTIMAVMAQRSWNTLGQYITPFNSRLLHWLSLQGYSIQSPIAYQQLGQLLTQQTNMIAFNDGSYLFTFLVLLLVPVVLFMDRQVGAAPTLGH